jgi:hypothetical protein
MASKIKADQFETLDGSGNITLNNSVTMASTKTLPAASLTGALPAISAASLTNIPAANITGTLPAISGANLTGITSVGGATGVDFNDNVNSRWGTGNDLRIYHDASHSYVNNQGTGDLLIRGDDVKIQDAASGHNMGVFVEDGGVELYHNNVKKFETTSAGGTLTGTWTGAGKVLQVVNVGVNADTTTSSSSYVDSGLSATITPTSTSNKILLVTSFITGGSSGAKGKYQVRRNGSTAIWTSGTQHQAGDASPAPFAIVLLDSPSTTSATTYNFWYYAISGTMYYHTYGSSSNGNIILMEIAG